MVSQDKVNIVIGEVVSATSQAISGLAQSAKVPLISAMLQALMLQKEKISCLERHLQILIKEQQLQNTQKQKA